MDRENLLLPTQILLKKVQLLVELAIAEDWQAMEILAADYQKKAAQLNDEIYLKELANANLTTEFQSLIEQIQTHNDKLDEQVNAKRESVATELRHIMQADKAMDAYRQ